MLPGEADLMLSDPENATFLERLVGGCMPIKSLASQTETEHQLGVLSPFLGGRDRSAKTGQLSNGRRSAKSRSVEGRRCFVAALHAGRQSRR